VDSTSPIRVTSRSIVLCDATLTCIPYDITTSLNSSCVLIGDGTNKRFYLAPFDELHLNSIDLSKIYFSVYSSSGTGDKFFIAINGVLV